MSTLYVSLVGFKFGRYHQKPIYQAICKLCFLPLEYKHKYRSMKTLAILDESPENIKSLVEKDKNIEKTLTSPSGEIRSYCSCYASDPRTPPDYAELCETDRLFHSSRKKKINFTRSDSPLISDNVICYCGTNYAKNMTYGSLWVCPFCYTIVCDPNCFMGHIKQHHTNIEKLIFVADKTLFGGSLCPFCRNSKTERKGNVPIGDDEWRHTITPQELMTNIMRRWERKASRTEIMDYYTTKYIVCQECFEKERMVLPDEAKTIDSLVNLPSLNSYPSPFYEFREIKLHQIWRLLCERKSPDLLRFFSDLLRHDHFEKINELMLVTGRYSNYNLVDNIWDQIRSSVNSNREIPATKFLEIIRSDIKEFNQGMLATNFSLEIQQMIQMYLPWQLWNMEKLLGTIHSDIKRYGKTVFTLLKLFKPTNE